MQSRQRLFPVMSTMTTVIAAPSAYRRSRAVEMVEVPSDLLTRLVTEFHQ